MQRREVQRRLAVVGARAERRLRLHQDERELLVALLDRAVQRRLAVLVARIEVHPALDDDALGDELLARLDRLEQAGFGSLRGRLLRIHRSREKQRDG